MPTDLDTITQQIQEEMVRPTLSDTQQIWRSIIDSIEYYSRKRMYFNEGVASWDTTVDKVEYGPESVEGVNLGYPDDAFVFDNIWYQMDDALFWPIAQRTISQIRRMQDNITAQGLPIAYAWHNQKIHFDRRAHRVFTIHTDYQRDVGIPVYNYNGASQAWEFYQPDGTTPLTGGFTNEWFTEAADLIRYRAQTRMARFLKDNDDFVRARAFEDDALVRLIGRTTAYKRPTVRTPAYL